jgi:hypothetical protein
MSLIQEIKKLNKKIIIVKNATYMSACLITLLYYPSFNDLIYNCLLVLFVSIGVEFLYNYVSNKYVNLYKTYTGICLEYVLLCSNFGINYLLSTYYYVILENIDYLDNISYLPMYISLNFYRLAYYRSLVYIGGSSTIMILFLVMYPFIKRYLSTISNFVAEIGQIPVQHITGVIDKIRNGQSIEFNYGNVRLISIPPKLLSINEEELERIAPKINSIVGDELCGVCLDNQTPDKQLVRKLSCGHIFHCVCVDQWFMIGHKLCPTCRAIIID